MKDKGCTPDEIADMDLITCKAYGIPLPKSLSEPKHFEQMVLKTLSE